MEIHNFIVKNKSGKSTKLDKEYFRLINKIIQSNDEDNDERWETYNFIIKELVKLDDCKYFQEIKYRLTDGENPNTVMLDVVSRYNSEDLSFLLHFLIKKVEEYSEADFFSRFIK